jgi:subtilisin family serine protease
MMKKILLTVLSGVFIVFTIHSQTTIKGVVQFKIKPEIEQQLQKSQLKSTAGAPLKLGVEKLDVVNARFKTQSMHRIFPDAGEYEAQHREAGLHLWYEVSFDESENALEVARAYGELEEITIAHPVYPKVLYGEKITESVTPQSVTFTPNDPSFNQQWHYHNTGTNGGSNGKLDVDINLPEAWEITKGSPDVIVAIIDGGINYTHPDLAANMWSGRGWNFVTNSSNISSHDHGTHVAGTVAAVNNNGIGVAGIAGGSGSGDGVRLMSCQVFTTNSSGGFANAFVYAADNGAVIAQNSWGYNQAGVSEASVLVAIEYFISHAGKDADGNPRLGTRMKGGIVIFAAGNDNENTLRYPGAYDQVVSVASVGSSGKRAYYSNYASWVDITAPGGDQQAQGTSGGVLSTTPNNGYSYYQGTSMACPHVSGVAALIVSKYGHENYTPDSLRMRLLETTRPLIYETTNAANMGTGLLDAAAALANYTRPTVSTYTEDFESDDSSWTPVNGTQTNKWVINSAVAASGAKSAYISNNTTSNANTYTVSSTSTVHLYSNITFPLSTDYADIPGIQQLSFDWKGMGEAGYDYMEVRLVETGTTPVAGTKLNTGTVLGIFNCGNTWQHATIKLPASCAGTTKRLVFTWINDNSEGTQAPIAIDNITVSMVYHDTSMRSEDATLANLTVSEGELTPEFSPSELNYTVNVANAVESITVTGEATHASAVVTGNVIDQLLDVGAKTVIITVKAENGITKKQYTVTINRVASDDATLSNLTVNEGELTPEFSPSELNYTVNVANNIESITVTGEATHINAVTSGNVTDQPLVIGENPVTITVTAEDGTTQKQYTVTINRAASDDATLSNLTVSEGELTPEFSSSELNYSVNVANNIESITVTGEATHINAVTNGNVTDQPLVVGENAVTITVTAEDGTTQKQYIVTINRVASDDATLSNLTVSEGELTPEFSSSELSYTVNVANDVEIITVTGEATHVNAVISGNVTDKPLAVGENPVTITVTAEDGTTQKQYTVIVERDSPLSIREINDESIYVYPNPSSPDEFLYLHVNVKAELRKDAVVEIYNLAGNLLQVVPVEESVTKIRINGIEKAYLLVFKTKDGYHKNIKILQK